MVNTLAIECPHCSKKFEVLLSSNATMLILNCPLCLTPLIYYKSRCFVLSKMQMEKIRQSKQDTTALKILHHIASKEQVGWHSGNSLRPQKQSVLVEKYISTAQATIGKRKLITRDDIVNLRIELETCEDSQNFIDKL